MVLDLYLKIIDVRNYEHHPASLVHPCSASILLSLVVPCEDENKNFLLISIIINRIKERGTSEARLKMVPVHRNSLSGRGERGFLNCDSESKTGEIPKFYMYLGGGGGFTLIFYAIQRSSRNT